MTKNGDIGVNLVAAFAKAKPRRGEHKVRPYEGVSSLFEGPHLEVCPVWLVVIQFMMASVPVFLELFPTRAF